MNGEACRPCEPPPKGEGCTLCTPCTPEGTEGAEEKGDTAGAPNGDAVANPAAFEKGEGVLPGPLLPVVAEAKGDTPGGVDAKGEVVDPPAPNGVALVVFPVQRKTNQKTSLK